ncbi:MAG: hypothetical protein ABI925_02540, partial [Verrucomicrobiota bacterium]
MRKILCYFTLSMLLLGGSSANSAPWKSPDGQTGTRQRLLVGNGVVTMDLDLSRLNGNDSATKE